MAFGNEPITTYDVPNYTGPLFSYGLKFGKSPSISRAWARNGARIVTDKTYPMANVMTGDTPSQAVVTEDASLAAVTNTSITASQTTNYLQIMFRQYQQSYASSALAGPVSGVAATGEPLAKVADMTAQRRAHLMQLASDMEFSALKGTAQAWTNAATSGATGGVVTAIEAGSETAASGAALSKDLLNTEISRMLTAGAEFADPVIFCNAFQYQSLSELYAFVPMSRAEGGENITTIVLPIVGSIPIVFNPEVATDDVVILDMAHYQPVFGLVPGKPPVFAEPVAKVAAAEKEQVYTIFGIDYHNILYHGMVSGLATS